VQDEIAAMIVSKLRIELAPQEQQMACATRRRPERRGLRDVLQGRAMWKRRGEDNLKRAIDLYQRALGLDPGFAAPTGARLGLRRDARYTREEDDEAKFMPLAVASARQALSIDPNIGEAHAVLAQINANRGNLLDAESGFFFAIPSSERATPHHWYSLLLSRVGRLGVALDQARRRRSSTRPRRCWRPISPACT